jgi:Sigma-70 region 2
MASRMDHFFQRIVRFSFINVTCKSADESYIPDDAQSIAVAVKHPPGFQNAVGLPILPVWPTQHGRCEDEALVKGSWAPPQTKTSAPPVSLTIPCLPGSAKHKPPRNPSAAIHPMGKRDLLTAEQERIMAEHLPLVRFIARRIHDRLPPHMSIEDLYSAGVLGLLDAFGKFDPSKQVLFPHICAISYPGSYSRQSANARLESSGVEAQGTGH